jgi:hypothetical protein
VYGRERIARLLPGFGTWLQLLGAQELRLAEVNGQPGALFLGHDGRAVLVVSLDIADGLVQAIHAVTNPEKLRHLDPRARRPAQGPSPRAACSLSADLDCFVAGLPEPSPSGGWGRQRAVTREGPALS